MENDYAEALRQMVTDSPGRKAMTAGKAVRALRETLSAHGRMGLLPRIARAFARLAERERARGDVTLSTARSVDTKRALREASRALKDMGVKGRNVVSRVDEHLVGGWRLEGRERLLDASYKKHLLSIFENVTRL